MRRAPPDVARSASPRSLLRAAVGHLRFRSPKCKRGAPMAAAEASRAARAPRTPGCQASTRLRGRVTRAALWRPLHVKVLSLLSRFVGALIPAAVAPVKASRDARNAPFPSSPSARRGAVRPGTCKLAGGAISPPSPRLGARAHASCSSYLARSLAEGSRVQNDHGPMVTDQWSRTNGHGPMITDQWSRTKDHGRMITDQ